MSAETGTAAPVRGSTAGSSPAEKDRWTLIFDGDCGFCRRQVRRIQRLDTHGVIMPVPFQAADLDRYRVSQAAAAEAMHLVAPSGEVWAGAAAAREALRLLPRVGLLAWIFEVPGVMWAAEQVYRWVARRRHRFGCGSPVCRRGGSERPSRDSIDDREAKA